MIAYSPLGVIYSTAVLVISRYFSPSAYNVDFYVHIPEVHNYHDLGDYYLNQSGMVQMPEEWKGGIDLSTFGRNAAAQEKGAVTEYGYSVESGDEWERQLEDVYKRQYMERAHQQPKQNPSEDCRTR